MRTLAAMVVLAASYAVPMGLLYTCVPNAPPPAAQGPRDMVAGCAGYGCEDARAGADFAQCGDTHPCSVVFGAVWDGGACTPSRCIAMPGRTVGYCYAEACNGH